MTKIQKKQLLRKWLARMEAVKVEQWLLNGEVIFVSHFLVINGARECYDLQTDRQTSPLLSVAGKHFVERIWKCHTLCHQG